MNGIGIFAEELIDDHGNGKRGEATCETSTIAPGCRHADFLRGFWVDVLSVLTSCEPSPGRVDSPIGSNPVFIRISPQAAHIEGIVAMDSCSASSPDEDVAIARTALAKGDYVHAAHHLACALGENPNRSDWLGLLDQVIAAEPDAEKLAPIKAAPPAYCIVAAHAYILARLGRVAEAIDLILQTINVRPDVLYIDWALDWLSRPEAAGTLNMGRLAWFISAWCSASRR